MNVSQKIRLFIAMSDLDRCLILALTHSLSRPTGNRWLR